MARIALDKLRGKTLYFETPEGSLAELVLDGSEPFHVRRLIVIDRHFIPSLERSDFVVPAGAGLDLDTGKVGRGEDMVLRHGVSAAGHSYMSAADRPRAVATDRFAMIKYAPLLSSPAIREALVYRDEDGVRAYDDWSDALKAELANWLWLRESGQDFPISGPPPLDENGAMTQRAARKIWLAHVAQSLWVEANHKVAWRLNEASAEHLQHLFDIQKLISFTTEGPRMLAMGTATQWDPVFAWRFMLHAGYIADTQWQTVQRLTDWCRDNLQHIYGYQFDQPGGPFDSQEDQWEYLFGYRGPPPVDKMIDPLPGRPHVTHACSGTSAFFAAVLRTVNVPVRHGYTDFAAAGHHRPEFFTCNRNLAHGDDPYGNATRPGVNTVPIWRIFYNDEDLEAEIDTPAPLPGMTVGETAGFNHARRTIALAVEYKTDWLLRKRCDDRAAGVSGADSSLGEALRDYYTAPQIALIEAACDAELASIPGACDAVAL